MGRKEEAARSRSRYLPAPSPLSPQPEPLLRSPQHWPQAGSVGSRGRPFPRQVRAPAAPDGSSLLLLLPREPRAAPRPRSRPPRIRLGRGAEPSTAASPARAHRGCAPRGLRASLFTWSEEWYCLGTGCCKGKEPRRRKTENSSGAYLECLSNSLQLISS